MKTVYCAFALLVLPLVAAVPTAAMAQTRTADPSLEFVRTLPAVTVASTDFAALVRAVRARAEGSRATVAERAGSSPALHIEFAVPLDGHAVAQALGLTHPYARSGDVHQTGWSIEQRVADVPDPNGRRIATRAQTSGPWRFEIRLNARPVGPLPHLVAGASPAYDLAHYVTFVRSIDIAAAR